MNASNAVIFEGATADSYETTLSIVDPTADHTQYLINQGGYIPVLAAATTTAISSTPEELNLIDGGTVRGTTAVASGDGILINDGGTMRMTNVDTVSTYFSSHNVGGGNIVTTGAINSGSITSGFGTIDTGSSAITTTGLISGGSLDIYNVLINGTTIGHTDDTDLITLTDGVVTVAGEISVTTLDIGGTNVTSTAAELNLIDGGTSRGTDAVASGDGILINDAGTMKMTNVDTVSTYFASHNVGGSNIVTTGTIATGVWNGTAIASAYLDADTAHLSGSQTFSGEKTFSANILMADDTSIGIADDAERIEFDSAGDISVLGANLGIGVSAPSEIVDIESADSTLRIASTTNGNSASIELVGRSTDGSPTENRCEILSTPAGSTANTMMSFKVENASGVLEKVRIGSGGNLMVGAGAFTEEDANGLDVSHGSITAVLGGDDSAYTRTNSTNKFCRIGMPHYTNSEEPIALIYGSVDSSNSFLHLGGATGSMNGVETITFNTASNTTTTSGTERMRINNAGNVGIGVVPEAWASAFTALQLGGQASFDQPTSFTAGGEVGWNSNAYYDLTDDQWEAIGTDQASRIAMWDGYIAFKTSGATAITADNPITWSTSMTIDPAFNVGFGIVPETWTATETALQIGGNGHIRATSSQGANGSMSLGHNVYVNSGYKYISTDEATAIIMGDGVITLNTATSGSADAGITWRESLKVNASGSVNISSPDSSWASIVTTTHASSSYVTKWVMDAHPNDETQMFLQCDGNGNDNKFKIWSNGELWQETGGSTIDSDRKLKDNIVDASPKLDDINKLKVRNFNYKKTPDRKRIGFIAQEVEEIFPSLVKEHPHTTEIKDDEGNVVKPSEYAKGIQQVAFIPMLIKAVQELSAKLDTANDKITALENA